MKQITTYIANDGTVFDNYEDCCNYEFYNAMNGIIGKKIRMFDQNLNPIVDKITLATGEKVLDRCAYIYLEDELAVETAQELYNQYGYYFPKKTGYWRYDYENDIWVSLDDEIRDLQKALESSKKEYIMMGGKINARIYTN